MERLRTAIKQRRASPAYEPLGDGSSDIHAKDHTQKQRFSWLEYYIFLLLGISMLWAWNMFLAASPYFQHRFASSPSLLSAYSPTLLSVSTVTNTITMLILTHLQSNAHYPHRIVCFLLLNIIAFTLLALSTVLFRGVSDSIYFFFLMSMVFLAALATGLGQNGVFAYVSGFGVGEYTQAIMAGQGVAGVLSCLAQIISVLSVPPPVQRDDMKPTASFGERAGPKIPQESGKSAFAYFLTATTISVAALLAFLVLLRRNPDAGAAGAASKQSLDSPEIPDDDNLSASPPRKTVGLWILYKKLHWLSNAIFLSFLLTMFFPVFTQQIVSTRPADNLPRLFQPSCFIPLAFLFWNAGDFMGRLLPLIPPLELTLWPRTVFALSIARIVWIPLYLLCNIHGNGAVVNSDFFYLVIVQFLFGLSNGFIGSTCMMGAGKWVEADEREAAGGFMGLMLVGGLSVGSLLSFLVA